MQHGKGKFVYRSGNVYEGEWSNDVPHGKGIFMEGNVIYDIEHDNGTVLLLCLRVCPRFVLLEPERLLAHPPASSCTCTPLTLKRGVTLLPSCRRRCGKGTTRKHRRKAVSTVAAAACFQLSTSAVPQMARAPVVAVERTETRAMRVC